MLLPKVKNAQFSAKKPVKYKIYFTNRLKTNQEGTLEYVVKNNKGDELLKNTLDVRINAKKTLSSTIEIPYDKEGDYQLSVKIDLTDHSESFAEDFSYTGPPIKAKDRKEEKPDFTSAASQDNTINGQTTTNETLTQDISEQDSPENASEDSGEDHEGEEAEGEIITHLKPRRTDAIYYNPKHVKYSVTISNKYKIKQEGTFTLLIQTELGETIGEKKIDLRIPRKTMVRFNITAPEVKEPGIYNVKAAVNTTTYDDTVKLAFGYKINQINHKYNMPQDFDEYWRSAKAELASVDPQYKIRKIDSFSTRFTDVYRIDMMGLGNIPFFAFLSVPKLKGKYPVVIGYGGYKKFVKPMLFGDFISLAVNVRGLEKESLEIINPDGKEQIVVNIEDKDNYIYRGIYTDCLRAIDFVYAHAETFGMDLNRVIANGGSQGATLSLVASSLRPGVFNSVIANNPVFADWKSSYAIGKSKPEIVFPTNALDKRLKEDTTVFNKDQMLHTLNYFDLMNFMPKIECPVLYGVGLLDEFIPAGSALAAFNKMPKSVVQKSRIYIFPTLGHEIPSHHSALIGTWFTEMTAKKNKK